VNLKKCVIKIKITNQPCSAVKSRVRFVMLIQSETFDYTKWRENLFEDMTIDELFQKASEYHE
jgi:hypothetical protein